MAYAEKIINRQEIGKKRFSFSGDETYIYDHPFKVEKVHINYVEIIQDSSVYPRNSPNFGANGIMGAILAGIVGVMVVSAFAQVKWDIDFDIHLTDGRVIEINTRYYDTIKRLSGFVKVDDPRAEKRRLRGV